MADLIHIVYVSFAFKDYSEKELEELLSGIRKKNALQGVTGLLLYNDQNFIQVIEGQRETIQNLFQIIEKDARHNNVVKLIEESIEQRAFPNWTMGFRRIGKKQSSRIRGFSNFLNTENPEKIIKRSTPQVMYLLDSFRKYT